MCPPTPTPLSSSVSKNPDSDTGPRNLDFESSLGDSNVGSDLEMTVLRHLREHILMRVTIFCYLLTQVSVRHTPWNCQDNAVPVSKRGHVVSETQLAVLATAWWEGAHWARLLCGRSQEEAGRRWGHLGVCLCTPCPCILKGRLVCYANLFHSSYTEIAIGSLCQNSAPFFKMRQNDNFLSSFSDRSIDPLTVFLHMVDDAENQIAKDSEFSHILSFKFLTIKSCEIGEFVYKISKYL